MPLPAELKAQKCWIVWKDDKRPYSAVTQQAIGWQNSENWATFPDALRVCKANGFRGVGFVFRFPYVGIDLDDCIEDDGMMNALAREVTNKIDTFTEYSRSGKGLHLYCKVKEPIKALKTGGIEIYGDGRYFIVTGKELDAAQLEMTDQTENIKVLLSKYGTKPAAETVAAEYFPQGERNNRMAAEVGRLFNFYDKETVLQIAHLLNRRKCRPALEDAEIEAIVKSIGKREIHYIPARSMEQRDWEHIEGKRDMDKHPYTGIAKPRGRFIPTGMPTIDYDINELGPGYTTLITGRTNAGKSVFVKQIIGNAISKGNKVLHIMGEGDQEMFMNALYECAIGRDRRFFDTVKINRRWHKEPKAYVLNALKKWHAGKLTLFDKGKSKFRTMDELFEMIEHEVVDNNFNLIVIDNLMSVLTAKAVEKNEAQGEFMQHCHDLADKYKIHVILVLHPNKEYRKGEELELEQISVNSDIYNKADNVLSVIREYSSDKLGAGQNGRIAILKNRIYSELSKVDTFFDRETGMLLEIYDNEPQPYDFDWMKNIDAAEAPAEVLTVIQGCMEDKQMREMGED